MRSYKAPPPISTSKHVFTRRQVIIAAGGLLAGCAKPPASHGAARVSIHRFASYSQALYDGIRRVLALHDVDIAGKKVVLKPNFVEFEPDSVINTNATVVHAVFDAVKSMGAGEVRIAEGPGHRRTTLDLAEAAGYFETIPQFEQIFTDLNTDNVSRVRLTNPASKLRSLYLPNTVLGADLLISIPKMKTHHWVGATLSMKNLFGIVPGAVYGWPKNILHWAGINQCIADLYRTVPKHFCIVDGIDGMEGNGPIQGTRKHAGVIVAGDDMAAVDATCCRIMGIDPQQIRYLNLAAGGRLSQDGIHQTGETIQSVKTQFELIQEFLSVRLKDV